jgi:hypothetical protein
MHVLSLYDLEYLPVFGGKFSKTAIKKFLAALALRKTGMDVGMDLMVV